MSTSVSGGDNGSGSTVLIKEPDWDHCLDIPNIQIKDAVSLSIGVNPSNYDDIQADIIKRKQYFPDKVCEEELGQVKRWHKRLLLAKRHAENGSFKIAKSTGVHWMVPEAVDIEHSEVNLVEFVQWSQSLRSPWELPEELLSLCPTLQSETDMPDSGTSLAFDGFDQDDDIYPYELDIALTAWNAVARNGQGGGGTPKQRLENWLSEDRGYQLKPEQIKRIATVCNWDKTRGRKQ